MMKKQDYIGDGVYVEYDGHQVKLWTQRDIIHEIYLDPQVQINFVKFLKGIME